MQKFTFFSFMMFPERFEPGNLTESTKQKIYFKIRGSTRTDGARSRREISNDGCSPPVALKRVISSRNLFRGGNCFVSIFKCLTLLVNVFLKKYW